MPKASDTFAKYTKLFKDECAEAKAFQRTLINGLWKRSYPHLVDDVIRVIQNDISRGQDASAEQLKTMFHNAAVFSKGDVLVPSAIDDAVKILRDGKHHGMVEQMIENGRYEDLHDPHWTGD